MGLSDELFLKELANPRRPVKVLSTNSKSGEIFLISPEGRFIIKTVTEGEGEVLVELLPRYVDHIRGTEGSMLGRYIGVYCINLGSGHGKRYVTLMQSVFDIPLQVTSMYDIKGSTHHRAAKNDEVVRKDQDWVADGCRFRLSATECQRMLNIHSMDTAFLITCNVMDYSLLIGIAHVEEPGSPPQGVLLSEDKTEAYCIGIIDFLVEYGMKKRAEHLLHQVRGVGETASVTHPEVYAKRQQAFFAEHVVVRKGQE